MLVPNHWAEAKKQVTFDTGRRATFRRFGWSDDSQEAAEGHARQRVEEACRRFLSGEKLPRREPKFPYNGASGVPIREEVLTRLGDSVVTRNSYGARCLNTPNLLFADIDFSPGASAWLPRWLSQFFPSLAPLARARQRIQRFLALHPSWNLRLYRTPAGLRLIATHAPLDPLAPETTRFFQAVSADRLYVRMCTNQRCFRARLSGKPWRMGIDEPLRPRPGVWPIASSRLPQRQRWVAQYEKRAQGYAACHYLESLGSGQIHPSLQSLIDFHDQATQAARADLPLA